MKKILMWTLGLLEIKKNESLALRIIFFSNHWKTRKIRSMGFIYGEKLTLKFVEYEF